MSLLAVGQLGSGKSWLLKWLAWSTVARGGQVVAVDRTPIGECARLAPVMPGRAQVLRLEHTQPSADRWSLDPYRVLPPDGRAATAVGFLSILAGVGARSAERVALNEAVHHIAHSPNPRLLDVIDFLRKAGHRRTKPDLDAAVPIGILMILLLAVGGLPPIAPAAVGAVPGISPVMLAAYQNAAALALQSGCRIPWYVLAGIGQVESGHAAGRTVTPNGDTTPPIIGPALNGDGYAAIADTDGGRWDSDPIWDRAVGPMQFIPTSWIIFGRDANRDGIANPHNAYDAAAAAAAHLCGPAPNDLTNPANLDRAIYSYNHDWDYVALVKEWADRYAALATAAPTGGGGAAGAGGYVLPVDRAWIDPDPSVLNAPHHDYPAWDLPLPEGTPVYAVANATVTATTSIDSRCGRGVILTQPDGYQWIYCHASALYVIAGQQVTAGQTVMLSGNTGNSTGPHLHLGLRTPGGVDLCPQALLTRWYQGGGIPPTAATPVAC